MNPLVLRWQVIEHRKRAKGLGCALLGFGHVLTPARLAREHQIGKALLTPVASAMKAAKPLKSTEA